MVSAVCLILLLLFEVDFSCFIEFHDPDDLRIMDSIIQSGISTTGNYKDPQWYHTIYPKKYAHGFVVLCFVVVMQSFITNSHEVFIHIQGLGSNTYLYLYLDTQISVFVFVFVFENP